MVGTVVAALALVFFPVLALLIWSWNELWVLIPDKLCCSKGVRIPPGHMGMFSFFWYFMIVCRPNDFIKTRRLRHGDEAGMYRSHLFGSPTIIACSPAINKFVLQSSHLFGNSWLAAELVGFNSLVAVNGTPHTRLRAFVVNAINQTDELKHIIVAVQPRMVSALRSWAEKGIIEVDKEAKKVTFENICKMFVSFEPGPYLHEWISNSEPR